MIEIIKLDTPLTNAATYSTVIFDIDISGNNWDTSNIFTNNHQIYHTSDDSDMSV